MHAHYLGPPGTYTQLAALEILGAGAAELVPHGSISAALDAVAVAPPGSAVAIVPCWNSLIGAVAETEKCLAAFALAGVVLTQTARVEMPIRHCLLANRAARELGRVDRVYSRREALDQCRGYLSRELVNVELVEVDSTAAGALRAMRDGAVPSAAILGRDGYERLFEWYISQASDCGEGQRLAFARLEPLADGIQDSNDNFTRFIAVVRS